jgi:hypothetical protein
MQIKGLTMPASTLALFSEIYLRHLKHKKTVCLLTKFKTTGKFPYIDNVLILYITSTANVYQAYRTTTYLSNCNQKITKLSSLYVIITVHTRSLQYSIFISGFGGLEVACWPLVSKFAGSHLAEAVGFLGRINPQHTFLQRGSKAAAPMS